VSYWEIPHDRILRRSDEMLGRTEEQYLAGSFPGPLEIGDGILGQRCAGEKRHKQDRGSASRAVHSSFSCQF
jgi:hypothetical protein